MNKHYIYLIFILAFFSCENTSPLELSNDYWEGEKNIIIAELNVNQIPEITIQKTFNPVITPLPERKNVTDLVLQIYKDDIYQETLQFNSNSEKYIGKEIVTGGHSYQIIIPQANDTIKSQLLFIPNENILVENFQTNIFEDTINHELKIQFIDIFEGKAQVSLSYSNNELRRNILRETRKTIQNNSCIRDSEIDLKCLKDTVYCRKDFIVYLPNRYTITENDSIILMIDYFSPELDLLKNVNTSIGFSANNPFKSSFNNAYGIFGYKHSLRISKSMLD